MSRGPVVETASGRVRGMSEDGVSSFKGIRYGADTSGARRFRPPHPAVAWRGVVETKAFGPSCPPTLTPADRAYFPTSPLWMDYAGISGATTYSEDCLCLNVWTEGVDDGGRRPVLVWLHGGGFSWGSGSSPLSLGDELARRQGLVVVSVNHRLGVLGYLDLDAVVGCEWEGSGVAGMLDLVLALAWVRDNIEGFGGDPANVTVVGHSGGGAKVSTLLAMPAARGLFQRAVIQSGVVSLRSIEHDESEATTRTLLDRAGLSPASASALQSYDATALADLASGMRFRPVLDDEHLPAHPFDPVAAPTAAGVPLLLGTTKDDAATFKFDSDPEFASLDGDGLLQRVARHPATCFGAGASDVVAYFRERAPSATPAELLVRIATATARERTILLAERMRAASGAPVYLYEFSFDVPMPAETAFPGAPMSPHAVELPFVFDLVDRAPLAGERPERFDLAWRTSAAWAAFATDGVPRAPDLPDWPPYEARRRAQMTFDVDSLVEDDPHGAERRRLQTLRPDPLPLATGRP